jgi:hypothetical protein
MQGWATTRSACARLYSCGGLGGIGLNLARALAAESEPDRARRLLIPIVDSPSPRQAEARAMLQRLSVQSPRCLYRQGLPD